MQNRNNNNTILFALIQGLKKTQHLSTRRSNNLQLHLPSLSTEPRKPFRALRSTYNSSAKFQTPRIRRRPNDSTFFAQVITATAHANSRSRGSSCFMIKNIYKHKKKATRSDGAHAISPPFMDICWHDPTQSESWIYTGFRGKAGTSRSRPAAPQGSVSAGQRSRRRRRHFLVLMEAGDERSKQAGH